jgi:hypothetical protein
MYGLLRVQKKVARVNKIKQQARNKIQSTKEKKFLTIKLKLK